MIYDYDTLQQALTINQEDLARFTIHASSATVPPVLSGTTSAVSAISDSFTEKVNIDIDTKLTKYSNAIYDILKDLGRIEVEREEWLSLIEAKMKE